VALIDAVGSPEPPTARSMPARNIAALTTTADESTSVLDMNAFSSPSAVVVVSPLGDAPC
jgi:hypothetical protein